MRIPKLAFVMLVIVALGIGSGLLMTKLRAQGGGPVVMLTIQPQAGHLWRCALAVNDPRFGRCAGTQMVNSGLLLYQLQALGSEGERLELGVRSKFETHPTGSERLPSPEFAREPQEKYWFEPGQKLEVEVAGFGPITFTGEFMDPMPTSISVMGSNELDPRANELRIASPLLLRDNTVVFDFKGMTMDSLQNGNAVELYKPGLGRYLFSLTQLRDAILGKVEQSRIGFELDGHNYRLLTGAPISRARYVWVLHQP